MKIQTAYAGLLLVKFQSAYIDCNSNFKQLMMDYKSNFKQLIGDNVKKYFKHLIVDYKSQDIYSGI